MIPMPTTLRQDEATQTAHMVGNCSQMMEYAREILLKVFDTENKNEDAVCKKDLHNGSSIVDWLEFFLKGEQDFYPWHENWLTAQSNCQNASTQVKELTEECDDLQRTYENGWCTLVVQQHTVCCARKICWQNKKTVFDADTVTYLESSRIRVALVKHILHMKCVVSYLNGTVGAEIPDNWTEACPMTQEIIDNASSYNVTFNAAPERAGCHIEPISPGDDGWNYDHLAPYTEVEIENPIVNCSETHVIDEDCTA